MPKTALQITNPDLSMPRHEREAALAKLPKSWRTTLGKAEEWPFVDPDEMLDAPTSSFGDYPADEVSTDIIPFSEFEPWGKMDEETDRDYELFSYYRASGLSRSQSSTARHFGINQTRVHKVAHENDWGERVKQWDLYREKIYTTEVLEETKRMAKDHAKIAAKGIRAVSIAFDELLNRIDAQDPVHIKEMNALGLKSLYAMVEKAARVLPNLMNAERLSRGLPTELSASMSYSESKIILQTTDDLAEIIRGLGDVLKSGQASEGVEIDVTDLQDEGDIEEAEFSDL
jgi:hypothetical protein